MSVSIYEMSNEQLKDLYFEFVKDQDSIDNFPLVEAEMVTRGLLGRA